MCLLFVCTFGAELWFPLMCLSDGIGRKSTEAGPRVSSGSMGSAPQCRPWDRKDLMRRLATFKAMTWFGKPKVRVFLSPLKFLVLS